MDKLDASHSWEFEGIIDFTDNHHEKKQKQQHQQQENSQQLQRKEQQEEKKIKTTKTTITTTITDKNDCFHFVPALSPNNQQMRILTS